jgi:hypothetical protein
MIVPREHPILTGSGVELGTVYGDSRKTRDVLKVELELLHRRSDGSE